MEKPLFPQALTTSFSSRIKNENTALYITTQTSRGTKRNATVVNYAEDYFDEMEDGNDDSGSESYTPGGALLNGFGGVGSGNGASTGNLVAGPGGALSFNGVNGGAYVDPNNTTGNALLNNYTGKPATRTAHAQHFERFSEIDMLSNAHKTTSNEDSALVPIRLNLEYLGSRIVDYFMWNINETLLTPDAFAEIMCQDLDLPSYMQSQVAGSIQSQIEEYAQLVNIQLPDDVSIHVIIDLSVILDKLLYEDKFEWDLTTSKHLTPEIFAETVVADLGLNREFYPAIAHSLHEAIIKLKKDCVEGRLPQEVLNGAAYGREAGWRFDPENLGQEWCPSVEVLSQWEIEKREIERERNIRRLKRESMRVEGESTSSRGRRRGTRRFDELEGTWVSF